MAKAASSYVMETTTKVNVLEDCSMVKEPLCTRTSPSTPAITPTAALSVKAKWNCQTAPKSKESSMDLS